MKSNRKPEMSARAPNPKKTDIQYGKLIEHATAVFGTKSLAEKWFARPCRFLDGQIPAEICNNAIGLRTVEQYLERIEYGVYQ